MIGRPPALMEAPPDKVDLAPDPRTEKAADGIESDLTGEIHPQGAIDGNHAVIAGDEEGVGDHLAGAHVDVRVGVKKAVEVGRSEGGRGNGPAWKEGLAAVVRSTPFSMRVRRPSPKTSVWTPRWW